MWPLASQSMVVRLPAHLRTVSFEAYVASPTFTSCERAPTYLATIAHLGSSVMERDPEPHLHDRILILRQPWLRLILAGEKTLEVRGRPFAPGMYWLGYKSNIYGVVRLGTSIRIETAEAWNECYAEHLVDLPMLHMRRPTCFLF